jgi:hypothetical protein
MSIWKSLRPLVSLLDISTVPDRYARPRMDDATEQMICPSDATSDATTIITKRRKSTLCVY